MMPPPISTVPDGYFRGGQYSPYNKCACCGAKTSHFGLLCHACATPRPTRLLESKIPWYQALTPRGIAVLFAVAMGIAFLAIYALAATTLPQ